MRMTESEFVVSIDDWLDVLSLPGVKSRNRKLGIHSESWKPGRRWDSTRTQEGYDHILDAFAEDEYLDISAR
jgi:hypothetical protein